MTVFDFDESEVGEYGEVVYAVIVPPLVREDGGCPSRRSSRGRWPPPPKAAREHAIERWHLPHWMDDVEVELRAATRAGSPRRSKADGAPALEIDRHRPLLGAGLAPLPVVPAGRRRDATCANILFEGEKSEHEEETGRIVLHDHAFNKDIVDLRGLRDAVPRAVDARAATSSSTRCAQARSRGGSRPSPRAEWTTGLRRLQPALRQGPGRPASSTPVLEAPRRRRSERRARA